MYRCATDEYHPPGLPLAIAMRRSGGIPYAAEAQRTNGIQ